MKKYLFIIKMVLLEKLQYVFNLFGSLIAYAIIVFIFMNLWTYMYNDTNAIAGYSLVQMTWYLSFTEIIWFSIRPKKIKTELTEEIKSGKIAYNLNKPFHYIWYLLSKHLGETIVSVLFYLTTGLILSFILLDTPIFFQIESIPFIIITLVFSTLIVAFIYILIAFIAFWLEDNTPFFWIYEKFFLILGVVFPIEIFPASIQPFIKYSPIYGTTYAPAKMFVDFNITEFLNIFKFQIIYLLLTAALCFIVYGRGVKKLSVNGG